MHNNAINIKNLSFKYHRNHNLALNHINLNIQEGKWSTLLGSNGSGKSTLIKLIVGLLQQQDGQIKIFDRKLNENNADDFRSNIGMVFQNPENQFVGSTVLEDVVFGLENQRMNRDLMLKKVRSILKQVQMLDFINHKPEELSGGQKQRVALAGAMVLQPKILILDEATSMLDPAGKTSLLQLVKHMQSQNQMTVLAITHDINEVKFSDYMIILNHGRIKFSGNPKEGVLKASLLKNCGLDQPLDIKIQKYLSSHGMKFNQWFMNRKELIGAIWQSNSKM
ncbi:energy-coupling factor transporter ATP-binding protein EcfA1 [Philodulcilactobacillus myokoensis]|uniref:Energy-coupling factor transporter ATP-binding protein EcfA1 n=1 Tax=Philodulcilactobacillus myokoensis TaxID=2929573 RepID=A0A9W6EUP4_9LACO|nr:energy-coupling factor transporter ATPase [Philodulcilactobacillus myokoensis]GLB47514.1 energy-coupling factor transporter ATP-binding protein EcfA1 [Philodulcilactobacillus myokoensis]